MRCYLVFFAVTVCIVLGLSAALSFHLEPINGDSGDLTTIGNYAENDFGWNVAQPVINLYSNGKFLTDPDFLVLGDSFSKRNVWQSVLATQLNKKILTFSTRSSIGEIDSWIEYALTQTSAKTIIIESVERDFLNHFGKQSTFKTGNSPVPFEMSAATTAATRKTWPPDFHIKHTFRVVLNTLKMSLNPDTALRGMVINAPLIGQCAEFSNHRNDRILYYAYDEDKLRWGREAQDRAIAKALQIQRVLAEQGKTFILIVVPDKLSVYQGCLSGDKNVAARKRVNITKALILAGVNTPDLLTSFQENINKIVDLYYPNDTHLSESGYVLMAEKLKQFFVSKSIITLSHPTTHSFTQLKQ